MRGNRLFQGTLAAAIAMLAISQWGCSNDDNFIEGLDASAEAAAGNAGSAGAGGAGEDASSGGGAGSAGAAGGSAGTAGEEAGAGAAGDRYAHLQSVIEQTADKVQGVSVAVVENGALAWSGAAGTVNGTVAAKPSSMYRSITLWATAIAALRLDSEGKLDIDAPVVDYVPELSLHDNPPELQQFTTKDLLTFRSGLSHGTIVDSLWNTSFTCLKGDTAFSDYVLGTGPFMLPQREHIEYPPGRGLHESLPAYPLLALVIERASNQKFHDYLTENVLKPLGITRSFFVQEDIPPDEDFGIDWIQGDPDCSLIHAMGGLHTSVEQMAGFAKFMFDGNPSVLPESYRAMMTSDNGHFLGNDSNPMRMGIGVIQAHGFWHPQGFVDTGLDYLYMGVSWGAMSLAVLVPSKKFAVIIASKKSGNEIFDIVQAAYEDLLQAPWPAPVTSSPEAPSQLGKYTGTYRTPSLDTDVTVTLSGQDLTLSWGVTQCPLVSTWPGIFTCSASQLLGPEVRFWLDGNGQPEYVVTGGWVAKRVN